VVCSSWWEGRGDCGKLRLGLVCNPGHGHWEVPVLRPGLGGRTTALLKRGLVHCKWTAGTKTDAYLPILRFASGFSRSRSFSGPCGDSFCLELCIVPTSSLSPPQHSGCHPLQVLGLVGTWSREGMRCHRVFSVLSFPDSVRD
jgi:hypothetical protein